MSTASAPEPRLPADRLHELLTTARVIPILTLDDPRRGVEAVAALVAGGLPTVEITLRTPRALEVVARVTAEVPAAIVGAGTVLGEEAMRRAQAAGAAFAVSPGLTAELARAARRTGLPLLPGVATVTEAMVADGAGFSLLKLFPAATAGGVAFLDAVAAPLPHLAFCPTGGVGEATFGEYLERPNVVAVGGSWMVPAAALRDGDVAAIERAARKIRARLEELAA